MSFMKTLLIGILALIGGCTVTVGGCTYGVGKAVVNATQNIATVSVENKLENYYSNHPEKADALFTKIATTCYRTNMNRVMTSAVPNTAVEERVRFDLYEKQIVRSGNPDHIKHLDAWRKQSNKTITSASKGKQKRELTHYLRNLEKHSLMEMMCFYNALENDLPTETKSRAKAKTASRIR